MKGLIFLAVLPVVLGQIPGGVNDIPLAPTDPVVVFAVQHAQRHLSENNGQLATLVEIVEAKSQVTNKVTYFLKLRMTGEYICDVVVVEDWQTEAEWELEDGPRCSHRVSSARRQLGPVLGGISDPVPLPASDDEAVDKAVLDALDTAVCAVSRMSPGDTAFKIDDPSGVTYTSQVTSGWTFRYYSVPLVLTSCPKDTCDRQSLSACDPHPSGKTKTCDFRVQHAPWRTPSFEVFQGAPDSDGISACLSLGDD